MDAIYEKLGERIVEAARTAALNHLRLMAHSVRQAPSVSGADLGRVTEDAAVSDALVDDCPAGLHPHPEMLASSIPRRAGRSPRQRRLVRGR
jgi:hypothetical protein